MPSEHDSHFTKDQLFSLYSKASDETKAVFKKTFRSLREKGIPELTALNQAHRETIRITENALMMMNLEAITLEREIRQQERKLKSMGLDPDIMYFMQDGAKNE